MKAQSGITLVALIITIIVLLILAMVSISLVINSGIIEKSNRAVNTYQQREAEEGQLLTNMETFMNTYVGNTAAASTGSESTEGGN